MNIQITALEGGERFYTIRSPSGPTIATSKKYKSIDSAIKALRSTLKNIQRVAYNDDGLGFVIKAPNGAVVCESSIFYNELICIAAYEELVTYANADTVKTYTYKGEYKEL